MIDVQYKGITSKKIKNIFEQAINFYFSKLFEQIPYLTIDLELSKTLQLDGMCTRVDDDYFLIEISKINGIHYQLTSLAHEIVHCKQYIKKELVVNGKIPTWKGKKYKHLTEHYYSLPWEEEAFAYESLLFDEFRVQYSSVIECEEKKERKKLLNFLNSIF